MPNRVRTLGELKITEAIQPLIAFLKDSGPGVRGEIALALGKFGALAKEAIPELRRLCQEDDNVMVRHTAELTLKSIEDDTPSTRRKASASQSPPQIPPQKIQRLESPQGTEIIFPMT